MMLKQTRRMSNTSTYIQEESFGKLVLLSLTIVYCRNMRVAHYDRLACVI
jgi:hypothetical protein